MDKSTQKIFVIGCTHFGHETALSFKNRKTGELTRNFDTIEEHDQLLIDNWNNTVSDDDIVYHLGDVAFCKQPKALSIIRQLKGQKRLVLGNHDNEWLHAFIRNQDERMFTKIYVDLPLPNFGVILSHRPLHVSQRFDFDSKSYLLNVHAHVHSDTLSDKAAYFNACAENIGMKPILLEEAIAHSKGAF